MPSTENYITQDAADARYQALGGLSSSAPNTIEPDDTASAGVSSSGSRADHEHGIATAAPSNIGTSASNSEGVSTSFARADHSHAFNPPRAGASRSSTQSISSSTWTLLSFTTEDADTDSMFTTATGDRFTCVTPGRYLVVFTAAFAGNTTGLRGWALAKGNTAATGFFAETLQSVATSGGHVCTIVGEVVLAAAETVSCQVFQSSGGALNIAPGSVGVSEPVRATIRWVAPS